MKKMAKLVYRCCPEKILMKKKTAEAVSRLSKMTDRVLFFTPCKEDFDELSITSLPKAVRLLHFNRDTGFTNIIQAALDDKGETLGALFVEHGELLTEKQVAQIAQAVDYLNVPAVVYGLKCDFTGELTVGSRALTVCADIVESITGPCFFCGKKSVMNLLVVEGKPVYVKNTLAESKDGKLLPVCRKCYMNPDL